MVAEIWVGIERDANSETWVWTNDKTPATASYINAVGKIVNGEDYCPAVKGDNSEISINVCGDRVKIKNFVLCEKSVPK